HTRYWRDWSSDVCSSDLGHEPEAMRRLALEQARQAVPADSKDHRDHLWLGQVAAAAGQRDQAEQSFRRACALNGAAPESWTALILFLARTDPKRAEAELPNARRQLPKDTAPLALAACYEALGKAEQAEAQYNTALAERPTDPAVLLLAGSYYARTA